MFLIGLTGTIGSGKSTVASMLLDKDKSINFIQADDVARKIVEDEKSILAKIISIFGKDIINPNGHLDRQMLANRAFSSRKNVKLLNDLIHPIVQTKTVKLLDRYKNNTILYEHPFLVSKNINMYNFDIIINVIASKKKEEFV